MNSVLQTKEDRIHLTTSHCSLFNPKRKTRRKRELGKYDMLKIILCNITSTFCKKTNK